MARTPRTATKTRTSGKAQKSAARKNNVSKDKGAKKAAAPTKQRRSSKRATGPIGRAGATRSKAQQSSGLLDRLVSSTIAREILADVLEAAAGALRKARTNVQDAVNEVTSVANDASETAVSVTAEMASGAAAIAQTATDMLANAVATTTQIVAPDLASPNRTEHGDKKDGSDFA